MRRHLTVFADKPDSFLCSIGQQNSAGQWVIFDGITERTPISIIETFRPHAERIQVFAGKGIGRLIAQTEVSR